MIYAFAFATHYPSEIRSKSTTFFFKISLRLELIEHVVSVFKLIKIRFDLDWVIFFLFFKFLLGLNFSFVFEF